MSLPLIPSPGPVALRTHGKGHLIIDAYGDSIAGLALTTGDHLEEEQLANARLFVASPDMLTALELVNSLRPNARSLARASIEVQTVWGTVQATLAKAKGLS